MISLFFLSVAGFESELENQFKGGPHFLVSQSCICFVISENDDLTEIQETYNNYFSVASELMESLIKRINLEEDEEETHPQKGLLDYLRRVHKTIIKTDYVAFQPYGFDRSVVVLMRYNALRVVRMSSVDAFRIYYGKEPDPLGKRERLESDNNNEIDDIMRRQRTTRRNRGKTSPP